MNSHSYDIAAYLPYIEFDFTEPIVMGPVLLLPASEKEINAPDVHKDLIKPRTATLLISSTVPKEKRSALLIDAIYLLYFATVFDELYLNHAYLPFNPFTYVIPAERQEKVMVKRIIDNTYTVSGLSPEVCQGLGLALQTMYYPHSVHDEEFREVSRIIRAIRFFVDRFFDKFHNVLNDNIPLTEQLFEPENIVFLATSFETLFNLSSQYPQADFKQKLRPLLHLKYSKPIDLFWKWSDGFYILKHNIVHSGEAPDESFRINENFILPYSFFGIKLFIYSVYYQLLKNNLLSSTDKEHYYPPNFKWLVPEEILIYLWPEKDLLMQIALLSQEVTAHPQDEELAADLSFLSRVYAFLFNRYLMSSLPIEHVAFFPAKPAVLEASIHQILHLQESQIVVNQALKSLQSIESHAFSDILKRRLTL